MRLWKVNFSDGAGRYGKSARSFRIAYCGGYGVRVRGEKEADVTPEPDISRTFAETSFMSGDRKTRTGIVAVVLPLAKTDILRRVGTPCKTREETELCKPQRYSTNSSCA